MAEDNLKARYDGLLDVRSTVDTNAEECAGYSLDFAYLKEDATQNDKLSTSRIQGFVGGLVDFLVGKLTSNLLPATQPFFRFEPTAAALAATVGDDTTGEKEFVVLKMIAERERDVLKYITDSNFRSSLYLALRYLIIAGNCLMERLENNQYRVISVRNYVVVRDFSGKIVELIIKELVDAQTLPDNIDGDFTDEEDLELYTGIKLIDGKYELKQQLNGEDVGETASFKEISDRYIDLRWNKVDGLDYGISFMETKLGTLRELEKETNMLSEANAVMAKTVFTVNPNGMTRYKDFVGAKHGKAIIGNETDIGTIKVNKASDLQLTFSTIEMLRAELAESFMKNVARDSERTTAYEIQRQAIEVESSFGGVYTNIASDVQIPVIKDALKSLKIDIKNDIDIVIISGVQALGRSADGLKLNQTMQELAILAGLIGNEALAQGLNANTMMQTIMVNNGVANANFIKSQTQQAQEAGEQKQEQLAQQALSSSAVSGGQAAGQASVQALANQGE